MNLDSVTTSVGLRAGTTGNVSFGLSTIGERKVIQVHTGGEKLGALHNNANDFIDLSDDNMIIEETRDKLIDFYYNKTHINACYYCKGREYGYGVVESAVQTKHPLPFTQFK